MARDGQQIYERLARQAADHGERQVGLARVMACVVMASRNLLVNWQDIARGQTKELVALVLLTFGAIATLFMLTPQARRMIPSLRARLLGSISFDVMLVTLLLAMVIAQPEPGYTGLLNMPYVLLYALTIAILPLRMSRRLIMVGATLNGLSLIALLGFDMWRHGERLTYGVGYMTFALAVLSLIAIAAMLVAHRLRALVMAGAAQAMQRERALSRLGAYVSPEIAQAALVDEALELGGARQRVAVLFSDLRGFTSYAEGLDPQELVAQLNAYFEVMVEVITAHGGVVDKYIGDAIMAVFGAPVPRPDDAARAISAALAMERALIAHNAQRASLGQTPLKQGIGLHVGEVVAGNIGTVRRAQYTIIGDTVNLAARLESETKGREVAILASREIVEEAGAGGFEEVATIQVRGRQRPVTILTPSAQDQGEQPQDM